MSRYQKCDIKNLNSNLVGKELEITGIPDDFDEEALFNIKGIKLLKLWFKGNLKNHEAKIPLICGKSYDILFGEDKIERDQNLVKYCAETQQPITVIGRLEQEVSGLLFKVYGVKTEDIQTTGYQMNRE